MITMDSDLSLVERGLLLSLLSYPDDFNFSIAWLSKRLPDGKEKIDDGKPDKKPVKKPSLFSKLGSMLKDFFTEDEEPSKI